MNEEIQQLKQQLKEYEIIFEMQRRRTIEADKLWQEENNKPETYPDLGTLISWLLQRYENLKCCGNCKYRESVNMGIDFLERCKFYIKQETLPSNGYCKKWEYDGLTQEERK